MSFSFDSFQIELENYQLGIENILPAYLNGEFTDEAFIDEVSLALHSRDYLENVLATAPRQTRRFLHLIEQLDRQLLFFKDELLLKVGDTYISLRIQTPRPRSHWWYFLDEIITQKSPTVENQVSFLLPLAAIPAV